MHRPHSAHWRLAGLLVLLLACTAAPAQESAWRAHSKCCTWRGNSLPDCAGCLEPNTPLQLGGEGSTLTHRLHFPAVWATWLQFQHKPITFEVQPCWGEASLHLGRGDPVDLDIEHLNVSATGGTASLSIPWNHVHYYVDVQRSAGAVVNISVLLPDHEPALKPEPSTLLISPNDDPDELVLEGDFMTLLVTFATPAGAGNYSYRAFRSPLWAAAPCPSSPVACVLTTPCGVQAAMEPATEWQQLPPGTNVTLRVGGLLQDRPYALQVLARSPDGHMVAYTPAPVEPRFTKVAAAHGTRTIAMVSGSIAGMLLVLMLAVVVAKLRINQIIAAKLAAVSGPSPTPHDERSRKGADVPASDAPQTTTLDVKPLPINTPRSILKKSRPVEDHVAPLQDDTASADPPVDAMQ